MTYSTQNITSVFQPFSWDRFESTAGGEKAIPVGLLTVTGRAINVSIKNTQTWQGLHETIRQHADPFGTFHLKRTLQICAIKKIDFKNIEEIIIDEIAEAVNLVTSRLIFQIPYTNYLDGILSNENCIRVYRNPNLVKVDKIALLEKLKLSMDALDFSLFLQLLAEKNLEIDKHDILPFLVKHRFSLGKYVTKRFNGIVKEKQMGLLEHLQSGDRLAYGICKPDFAVRYLTEELRIYEIKACPEDPQSPLIGYARVEKNVYPSIKFDITIDDLFNEFDERSLQRQNSCPARYTVSFLNVQEEYRNRGFAYVLLHRVITDILSEGRVSVELLDMSGSKAGALYEKVGEFVAEDGQKTTDFTMKKTIFRGFKYTRNKD